MIYFNSLRKDIPIVLFRAVNGTTVYQEVAALYGYTIPVELADMDIA